MGKIKLVLGAVVLLLSSQVSAAILHVNSDGFLTGASRVDVLGVLYNAQHGSWIDRLFDKFYIN